MNYSTESECKFFCKIKTSTNYYVPQSVVNNKGLALYEAKFADELGIERFSRLHHLVCYLSVLAHKFLCFKNGGGFFTEGEPYDQFAQLEFWKVNKKYGIVINPDFKFFMDTYNCSREQAYTLFKLLIENNILAKIPNIDYSSYYFTEHFRKSAMIVSEYYKDIETKMP